MKIGILGDGAMGCLFGAYLSQKNDVVIFGRSEEKSNKLKLNGIYIEEKTETRHFNPMTAIYTERFGVFDLLIILVKSFALQEILEKCQDKIGPETYILTLQSGAGQEKIIEKFADKSKILIGITEHCAQTVQTGEIRHTKTGDTIIGFPNFAEKSDTEKANLFMTVATLNFILCGIETKTAENILPIIWHKILVEFPIEITTALLQSTLDFPSKNANSLKMIERMLFEALKVADSSGFVFDFALTREEILNLAKCSAGRFSKIYSDLKNKTKTEVDFTAGFIIEQAEKSQIEIPCIKFAVEQIHALEEKNSAEI